jgi:hypothetical protein
MASDRTWRDVVLVVEAGEDPPHSVSVERPQERVLGDGLMVIGDEVAVEAAGVREHHRRDDQRRSGERRERPCGGARLTGSGWSRLGGAARSHRWIDQPIG